MNELALFAGAGGGILGGKLLGWDAVCAVELDPYCRDVLMARQNDGLIPPFPIWDDVRTFDGAAWRGRIDVVSGGFPCQAFSTASRGRRTAEDLWEHMREIILQVNPRWVFAENVQYAPVDRAARDLWAAGFDVEICRLGASAVGAPHRRIRWWLVAHADGDGERIRPFDEETPGVCCASENLWPEPGAEVLGNDDGVANRMDRLRAIGNGQVPIVAALAFQHLSNLLISNKNRENS